MVPNVPSPSDCELLHPGFEAVGCLREDKDIESDRAIPLLDSLDFDNAGIGSSFFAYHVKSKPHDRGGAVIPPDTDLVEREADVLL
jgi:hypothetical protein